VRGRLAGLRGSVELTAEVAAAAAAAAAAALI